jgi:hypothetical protein
VGTGEACSCELGGWAADEAAGAASGVTGRAVERVEERR